MVCFFFLILVLCADVSESWCLHILILMELGVYDPLALKFCAKCANSKLKVRVGQMLNFRAHLFFSGMELDPRTVVDKEKFLSTDGFLVFSACFSLTPP